VSPETYCIMIGSTNKVKVEAVKIGFQKWLPKEILQITPVKIEDVGIPSMPLTHKDLLFGAKTRAESGIRLRTAQDAVSVPIERLFGVGLEGGLDYCQEQNEWLLLGLVYVLRGDGRYGFAQTAAMMVPKAVVSEVLAGSELAHVIDRMEGESGTSERFGAFGAFTDRLFSRSESFVSGLVLALAPFFNRYYTSAPPNLQETRPDER